MTIRQERADLNKRHTFTFQAHGHPNIRATHRTTIEITRSEELTMRGDCVIAVGASRSLLDLPEDVRYPLTLDSGCCKLVMTVGGHSVSFTGRGAEGLKLSDPYEMVARKSRFLSDRTLMVGSDRSASEIPRDLVAKIRNSDQNIGFRLLTWLEPIRC